MSEIIYNPKDVGKQVMNGHGKLTRIRKYHMTDKEQEITREKWEEEISGIDRRIIRKAGKHFFNPYRRGIYYYQIYSLFCLGANQWHSLGKIVDKMEYIMSQISVMKDGVVVTSWEKFKGKRGKELALRCKDFIGRIQENMIFFQRLNKLHPTGYKLMQVRSAVDMRRITRKGFPAGCFFYRLSTYDRVDQALPIRDYSNFKFLRHERKYINYKFIGIIVTKNGVITKGKKK